MTVYLQAHLRTLRLLGAGLAAAALLAACGGGTEQEVTFKPNRIVALGEDSSVIDDSASPQNGVKYAINGVDSSQVRQCGLLEVVPQFVARHYGMVFDQCRSATQTATAFNRAKAGARVEDASTGLAAQIDAQTSLAGALGSGDLVTVWIGSNDILAIYRALASGSLSHDQAVAEAERLGARVGQLVNDRILATGARALVFTTPDMGLSPYARARLATADPDDAAVGPDSEARNRLSEISNRFNGYMRITIDPKRFDGRNFGLVFADEAVQAIDANSSGFTAYLVSPYNISDAACGSTALTACTNANDGTANTGGLVSGAAYHTHLWASDRWLAYPAHHLLGVQAQSRLNTLPF